MNKEEEYRHFLKYFFEITQQLDDLIAEAVRAKENDELLPQSLESEIFRHDLLMNILTQYGEETYNKSPEILLNDYKNLKVGGTKI